jgi:2-polyprenyl-3-methyl-5-hydroxy-6-metoxy-1,4-benzoquinol methylase
MSGQQFSDDDVAAFWNGNAALWAEQVRDQRDIAREFHNNPAFLAVVGDVRGKDVLDAGCGEGYNTRILARRGARMTGVDVSARMIELAWAEERREPLGIRYACTSYTDLQGFPDESFDAVVSFMALMDGARFDLAMSESFRVLRRGGMLAFSITHPCFITKGSGWLRDEQGVKVKWLVSEYFNPAGWVEHWRFTDATTETPTFASPRFDRTLSEYVNTIVGAGFTLTRIEEPRPSEEYCRAHPSQQGWRDHAALFLHFRAEKPA